MMKWSGNYEEIIYIDNFSFFSGVGAGRGQEQDIAVSE
jgi:hypothetical protein